MSEQPFPDRAAADLGRSLSPAALVWESDEALRDALMNALSARGYRVVVAPSLAAARRLLAENHFDRVFGCVPPSAERSFGTFFDRSGPRVMDLGDGTARVHLDQVVPWSAAVELLDVVSAAAVAPKRHS